MIRDKFIDRGLLLPQKKGIYVWRDREGATWLIWNLTDRTTTPRSIHDEEWKYRISIDPSIEKNSQENIEEAVKDWLKKEAVKQEPPESNWLFYLDVAGNVHKNPESGGEGS